MATEFSEAAKANASLGARLEERANISGEVLKDDSNRASFPDFPYALEARGLHIIVNVDLFKSGYECKKCKGTGKIEIMVPVPYRDVSGIPLNRLELRQITCDSCNGKTASLILPDTAKSLPCTGVVVSKGPLVDSSLALYSRVIFGPYSGRFIPISKAGVLMKIMDHREATAIVHGGEDLASFDFIDIDKEMS